MAGASNGVSASAALDDLKPPPGVIIPPPGDIRETIEKTAGYVLRGGPGLEQRIRDNHGQNPKFSFLMTKDDPFNAFYEWRKSEIKAGRGTDVAAGRAGEAVAAPVKEEPKGPPKPPDFQFSARMPRMSQKDFEIVRTTAKFVAKHGRPFMTQLAQRESSNPQYQFLVPNHTFHNFFQSLVEQYTIIMREGSASDDGSQALQKRLAELKLNVADKFHILPRAKQRADYAKWQAAEKAKQEQEEEKKKIEHARIDWNDFVVVETIDFTEDDKDLPPPTTLHDLQYASLEEKNKYSISSNLRIEEAFPFEDTNYNAYPPPATYAAPAAPAQAPTAPTQPVPQSHPAVNAYPNQGYNASAPPGVPRSAEEEEELQRIQEREQARARMHQARDEARGGVGPIKIKDNYVPRAAQKAANKAQMAICPNCKLQIPINELDEHMRIEMLDPRWKEQKAKAEARFATTNLSVVDVANNLKRMRQQDENNSPADAISEEEQARRKKVALNSYDGNPDGKSHAHINHLQSFNMDEQIRNIHQKYGGDKKP
ncbi:Pre-mRNA splicing factor PRP21 like domain containing protein [Naviculisporaceae sp. PSN 640]